VSEGRVLVLLDEQVDGDTMLAAVDTLAEWPRLALDTEADSFHRYFERVCLIQISSPDRDLIFDPLAHGMPDPLRRLLTDAERTWVLHGGDYDVLSLKRDFDLELGRVFDTMIAARFVGLPALGLQAVLHSELGVEITKSEQRSDWGARPLTAKQIGYARQDTQHLVALAEHMIRRLSELGRLEWVLEECELLRKRAPVERPFDEQGWIKLKGARTLPESGQRALRAAFLWREAVAERTNKPPFRVITNETLVSIAASVAKEGPRALADLSRRRGVPRGLDTRSFADAIREGLADRTPLFVRKKDLRPPALDPPARDRLDRLKAKRTELSASLGLDPGLLIPTALLESLAREAPCDISELRRFSAMTAWRLEAVGPPILDILQGKE
jgi:ribonuclease D